MATKTNLLRDMFEEELHQMPEKNDSDPKFRQVFKALQKGDIKKAKKLSDLMAQEKSVTIA